MKFVRTASFYILYSMAWIIIGLGAVEAYLRVDNDALKRFYYWVYDPPMYAPSDTMPYTLRPNVDSVHFRRGEFNVHVHTNSQGLREDREIAIPKSPDTYRILVIGDSFAFGYGVNRNETFQAIAENALNHQNLGKKVEIVDMGFAAAGSLDARYVYMRDTALRFQPDAIVVVFFYGADLGRVFQNRAYSDYDSSGAPRTAGYLPIVIDPDTGFRSGRYGFETQKARHLFFPQYFPRFGLGGEAPTNTFRDLRTAFRLLLERNPAAACVYLRLCTVIQKFIEVQNLTGKNSGQYQAQLFMLPSDPSPVGSFLQDYPGEDDLPIGGPDNPSGSRIGWEMSQRIFRAMQILTDQHGVKFGVLFVPSPILVDYDPAKGKADKLAKFYRTDEMEAAIKLNKPDRLFGGWFKSQGIAYFDPTRPMRSDRERAAVPFYFEYDQHWNVAGHASLGRRFAEWLEAQKWM